MTEVERSGDCGNSPKNKLLEDLSVALYTSDAEFVLDRVTDDIQWNIVGEEVISSTQDLAEAVGKVMNRKPRKLTILHVVTHGRAGAVNGRLGFGEAKTREFCHVYEFSNTKGTHVKAISSYMIDSQ
jgi:hypothetical protein